MLTVGSLFSGIGGLELGLERAGMKTIWQVERDPFARAVLKKNFPGVPCHEDVRRVGAACLARPDVLCGGFPCQPHSDAGLRRGSADERDLWPEFARLIRELAPRWVVAENVRGLLSTEGGAFFGRVLRDLAELGLDAEWGVLPACALGAPHMRKRVFLVAYPHGLDGAPGVGSIFGLEGPLPGGDGEASPRVRLGAPAEPTGVAYGLPDRVDRTRAIGNAVHPDTTEYLGGLIAQVEARRRRVG